MTKKYKGTCPSCGGSTTFEYITYEARDGMWRCAVTQCRRRPCGFGSDRPFVGKTEEEALAAMIDSGQKHLMASVEK